MGALFEVHTSLMRVASLMIHSLCIVSLVQASKWWHLITLIIVGLINSCKCSSFLNKDKHVISELSLHGILVSSFSMTCIVTYKRNCRLWTIHNNVALILMLKRNDHTFEMHCMRDTLRSWTNNHLSGNLASSFRSKPCMRLLSHTTPKW